MNNTLKGKYLEPSEHDSLWGLETTCIGTQQIGIQAAYPPRFHPSEYHLDSENGRVLDEYQLVYLVSGNGMFESRHCPLRKIQSGDVFMLFPGEWHSYKPLSDTGWEEYWVGFRGKEMDNKVANGFFNVHSPVFRIGLSVELVNLYSNILDISQKQPPGCQAYISGMVSHMLGLIYSQSMQVKDNTPQVEEMVKLAKIYISANLQCPLYSTQVAQHLKVIHLYFCRRFKQYTGFSPSRYIREMRIQRSKQLLCTTSLNSQQIAYDCGFESSGYFCMAFRKSVGMTPLEYRRLVCSNDAPRT